MAHLTLTDMMSRTMADAPKKKPGWIKKGAKGKTATKEKETAPSGRKFKLYNKRRD